MHGHLNIKWRVLFCPRYKPFKTLRRHTPVNLTLRRDIKVTNVCSKDAHACCRSSMSRSLMFLINLGQYLRVALLPYHRLGGALWNPDFYSGVGLDVLAYHRVLIPSKEHRRPHIYVVSPVVSHVTQPIRFFIVSILCKFLFCFLIRSATSPVVMNPHAHETLLDDDSNFFH